MVMDLTPGALFTREQFGWSGYSARTARKCRAPDSSAAARMRPPALKRHEAMGASASKAEIARPVAASHKRMA